MAVVKLKKRRGGRAVDGASLENWNTGNRIGGSNPSLSAITFVIWHFQTVIPRLIPSPRGRPESPPNQKSSNRKGAPLLPRRRNRQSPVKPDYGDVDGTHEKHAEGAYYLEWRESGKRRLSVGKNAGEDYALKLKKVAELNATAHGIAVSPALPTVNGKRS